MLSSLPLVAPRDAHTLWYTPSHTFGYTQPPIPLSHQQLPPVATNSIAPHARQHPRESRENRRIPASYGPSALTQLTLDEQSVEARKLNIQRFGSTWIRPPGIAKTLQGEIDEQIEREEHRQMEEAADEGMTGLIQNSELPTGEELPTGVEVTLEDEEEEGERETEEGEEEAFDDGLEEEPDLDAEIPEGSAGGWSEEEEEDDDEDEGGEEDDDEPDAVSNDDTDPEPQEVSHIISEGSISLGEPLDEDSEADISATMGTSPSLHTPASRRLRGYPAQVRLQPSMQHQHSPHPNHQTPLRRQLVYSPASSRRIDTSMLDSEDEMEVDSDG